MTFARALRSILRQDPDVIMVGEIRDAETADIAVKSALTGHLVLSTVHANAAPGTVTRLVDMGVPRYLLGSAVTLVMAQRLVRRSATAAARASPPSPSTSPCWARTPPRCRAGQSRTGAAAWPASRPDTWGAPR